MPFKRWIYQIRFVVHFWQSMRPRYSFRRCLGWHTRPDAFSNDPIAEAEELARVETSLFGGILTKVRLPEPGRRTETVERMLRD